MTDSRSAPITFLVPGSEGGAHRGAATLPADTPAGGRVKQSVRVGARREAGALVRVTAIPGEDALVLHIAQGPSLVLHPENARDLLLAQDGVEARAGRSDGTPGSGAIEVPAQLRWRGLGEGPETRGGVRGRLGSVLISAIDVVTDLAMGRAARLAASHAVARVDAQVEPGVYALSADTLRKLGGGAAPLARVSSGKGGPLLVFVHGTFSETHGSFGRLWSHHPQRVQALFRQYGGRVYALDHPTLGQSPIENALLLARTLEDGARLHLVTHSRGGLVAEVLARTCAAPVEGFSLFAGTEHKAQHAALKELGTLVRRRKIGVERVVRVACPARGTLLASKRLDAYVSVLKWSLELARIPVAPAVVEFLGAVAQYRTDPETIPGLAAQMPGSPLVQWLHGAGSPLPGDLRVVAGDMAGDSVISWLKTLLSDAFYWTDNDLVVQTRSMYGGAPRASSAIFRLDQGGTVSHFKYFANERTAEAIVSGLIEDAPQGFRTIGPLSWAGGSSTGVRAARRSGVAGARESGKPAVFVLPGMLGSHLKVNGERVWLSWRLVNGLQRLEYSESAGVEPDGPLEGSFDGLSAFLSQTHEVVDFAYDWRRPIEVEARRLAGAVEGAIEARHASGQPVRLLAHSSGGLVARTVQLEAPDLWNRMLSTPGARVLLMGTPNAGMWTPMQVLSGDDTLGHSLGFVDAPFRDLASRALMAGFPGFLQLQAGLLDPELNLSQHATWNRIAEADLERVRRGSPWHSLESQLNPLRWGIPGQEVLDAAVALRRRLDAQRESDLPGAAGKLVIVLGRAPRTTVAVDNTDGGFFYLDAHDAGDGRVSNISALLPGVRAWVADAPHAELPRRRQAFHGYLELLQEGSTSLLPAYVPPVTRLEPTVSGAVVQSRPSRSSAVLRPPEGEPDPLGVPVGGAPGPSSGGGAALQVTVLNGDLTFIREPLLIGHYSSLRLTGTERVMDSLIGGAMEASLRAGLYPDAPGEHQVFVNTNSDPSNPWRAPRPEAVMVAGLGEEGKLRGGDLVRTVRQAVLAWAQRMAERQDAPPAFDLAATLIGSGGTGIAVGQSAQLVAQGVAEANERIERAADTPSGELRWPRVGHLHLIELYMDRATEAWRGLQMQAAAAPRRFVVTGTVQSGAGALPRPIDSGYRGAEYDFITAVAEDGPHGQQQIAYTLDTRRARTEIRAQAAQSALLRDLVEKSSNDRNTDTRIGHTLFKLLVPPEMEPYLAGTTEFQIELDRRTAGIPWELLDTTVPGSGDVRPWAIRAKLLRKLRTAVFRGQVRDSGADAGVLVIGEPACDRAKYPHLPGAREEALAVESQFRSARGLPGNRIKTLISPDDERKGGADARTVVNTLLEREWRIVHIAGHGEPPTMNGDPRGVVLSNGVFLGPHELRNMRTVPELVFVNCCHLAARRAEESFPGGDDLRLPDRAQFAAGVAEELINIGVRCVVAAGWAVEDEPAKVFATTFYRALLRKRRFLDAVAAAREEAYALGGNTWAAYQCYGDPDWLFDPEAGDPQRPARAMEDEYAGVGSLPGLVLALQTLAVQSTFQGAAAAIQRARIRYLEERFGEEWGRTGTVAEAFGAAWAAAGGRREAIAWYGRGIAANDGTASIRAAEQGANLQVREAWATVDAAVQAREAVSPRARAGEAASQESGAASSPLREAEGALAAAAHVATGILSQAISTLEALVAVQSTMERESLLGSAYKRQAMIDAAAGGAREEKTALAAMRLHYERAERLGRDGRSPDLFYPGLNRLAGDIVCAAGPLELNGPAVDAIRESLEKKIREDPDFWSVVGQTELCVYEAMAAGGLEGALPRLIADYQDLHARVSAPGLWSSVYDQARFVFPKYVDRASAGEREAAGTLLSLLESWATSSR